MTTKFEKIHSLHEISQEGCFGKSLVNYETVGWFFSHWCTKTKADLRLFFTIQRALNGAHTLRGSLNGMKGYSRRTLGVKAITDNYRNYVDSSWGRLASIK